MTDSTDPPIKPNEMTERDTQSIHAKAGYPFPMGPVIPRPDATLPPLWPGLLKAWLNRPKAAAEVLIRAYSDSEKLWTRTKVPLTADMDLTFRNLWQRVDPQSEPERLKTAKVALRVLEGWVNVVRDSEHGREFSSLASKLISNIQNSYHSGRNNARGQPLLFAPPYYPALGRKPPSAVGAVPWEIRYSRDTGEHVRKLLTEPAGEWSVLTLLFIKLLHAHMAWLVPRMGEKRQVRYYRPLLRQLRQCAEQAGAREPHPLAETAAGILQNLCRVNLLLFWADKPDPMFMRQSDELNPCHELLPDSLHMNSSMWVDECVSEAKQLLLWMDEQDGGNDWAALLPWVDDVANLAWEVASARTDPFAMGGLGLADANPDKTAQTFKSFAESWVAVIKGVRARVHQINGMQMSPTHSKNLDSLPERFKAAFATEHTSDGKAIRDIELWAERPAQLRDYYTRTSLMLLKCGLDTFQANKGAL